MNKLIKTSIMMLLFLSGLTISVRAEVVTIDEAKKVAENWISTIIHLKGSWGNHKNAKVENIHELRRGNRILGYFCSVDPEGYIVISIHKALAPVKLYSVTGNPNTDDKYGIIEFVKNDMEQTLNAIEKELGSIATVKTKDVNRILKTGQNSSWNKLTSDNPDFTKSLKAGTTSMGYEKGTRLLNTKWNQIWPYNKKCPDLGCTDSIGQNDHAFAGCAAIAAAQVMRYWSWPPGYDWLNMDELVTKYSPNEQINAIATLIYDAGTASGMNYGCGSSWIFPNLPMNNALVNNFKYNADHELGGVKYIDPILLIPIPYDIESWHNLQKDQLNAYRPLLYGSGGMHHTFVVDGWDVIDNDTLWHLNIGWGGAGDVWETRDYIPVSDDMVKDIEPINSVDPGLLKDRYDREDDNFPYRYFPYDCLSLTPTTFGAGQNLQFLPGVKLKTVHPIWVRFESSNSSQNRLYSIKMKKSANITIKNNGAMKLQNGGGITFLSRQQY